MSLTYPTLNDALNSLVFSRLAHLDPEMFTSLKASFLNHTLVVADIAAATLTFDADNAGFKDANLSDSEFLDIIERNIGTLTRITSTDDLPDGTYYTTSDTPYLTDEFLGGAEWDVDYPLYEALTARVTINSLDARPTTYASVSPIYMEDSNPDMFDIVGAVLLNTGEARDDLKLSIRTSEATGKKSLVVMRYAADLDREAFDSNFESRGKVWRDGDPAEIQEVLDKVVAFESMSPSELTEVIADLMQDSSLGVDNDREDISELATRLVNSLEL